jgi:hypothetical protein
MKIEYRDVDVKHHAVRVSDPGDPLDADRDVTVPLLNIFADETPESVGAVAAKSFEGAGCTTTIVLRNKDGRVGVCGF